MKHLRTLALLSFGAAALSAHAADLGLAKNFNAFVSGNYAAISDSDGAVAVGGNFSGSQNNAMHVTNGPGYYGALGTANKIGLYVGGTYGFNANGANASTSINGNAQATVYFNAKTASSTVNNSAVVTKNAGNAALFTGMANDFSTTFANLKSQSNQINALATSPANSTKVIQMSSFVFDQNNSTLGGVNVGNGQNLTIDLTKFNTVGTFGGIGVYVLNIDAAGLSAISNVGILGFSGLNSTHTVLLNFTGTSVAWNKQLSANNAGYSLFNFANATTVSTSGNEFNGSILAPNATVTQGHGNIQGNIVAKNFVQGAEIHYDSGPGAFKGWVPTPQAVPEPASMVALGLGGAALLRRRRK